MSTRQVSIRPGHGQVEVRASTLNQSDRTVEIIWATGAIVPRYAPDIGSYMEELSMDPKHIRMDRFQTGMSLLDSHSAGSMDSRLGTVLPRTVRIVGGKGYATVKLSRKRAADELFQDLLDGHPFPVSVGYRVYAYERQEAEAALLLRAIDWEPFELSAVPVPADGEAHSRAEPASEGTECRIITLATSPVAARMRMRHNLVMGM